MNSACHGLKMSFSEERCRNCKKIPSLSFNLVPQTISNTVICTMQIVLASVFTKYLQSISAEFQQNQGLKVDFLGVTQESVGDLVIPWHPMGRSSRSLAFPSRNCHSTGSLALDWVVYPQVSQQLLADFWSICEHLSLSFHVISISFRLSHAETYLKPI